MARLGQQNESGEQIALFEWAHYNKRMYPPLELLYHIPNGGHRHKTTAAKLKAEGVKAGVPDICLPYPSGKFHGLYIEMKAGKNKTTASQELWLDKLSEHGYYAAVCHGWQAAAELLVKYIQGGDLP